jgi:SOS-response transcriptional repressor LexA
MDWRQKMWSDRLNDLLKNKGWSQAELSRRSGVSLARIKQYCQGRIENPRGSTMEDLAHALGVTEQHLRYGAALPTQTGSTLDKSPVAVTEVEVVGEVRAGSWVEAQEHDAYPRFTIPVVSPAPGSFALLVVGPSMDLAGYLEGDFVVVEPLGRDNPSPINGDHVVAERIRVDGLREVTCKEYVTSPDNPPQLWPRSSDPRYQSPLVLDDDADTATIRVLGIVRGSYRQRPTR